MDYTAAMRAQRGTKVPCELCGKDMAKGYTSKSAHVGWVVWRRPSEPADGNPDVVLHCHECGQTPRYERTHDKLYPYSMPLEWCSGRRAITELWRRLTSDRWAYGKQSLLRWHDIFWALQRLPTWEGEVPCFE